MKRFEALFGIKEKEVKKTCILLPSAQKGILAEFRVKNTEWGRLYASAKGEGFTVIHTGMGAGFTADAVLYLKETPCRNIILFGSCGLVREKEKLSLGSLVTPFRSYAYESFSSLLLGKGERTQIFSAHQGLLEDFLKVNYDEEITRVTCATLCSLKLEEEMQDTFRLKNIEVLDMECSAVYCAAGFSGLKAIAIFYISDIVDKMPFYSGREPALKSALSLAQRRAVRILCKFIKENLGGQDLS